MQTESDNAPLAQALLRQADELFFRVLDATSDAVTLSRVEDERFVYSNEAFCDLTGYRQDEVVGRTGDDLALWAAPSDRTAVMDLLGANGSIAQMQTRIRIRTGETRPTSLSAQVLEVRGVPCVLTVARDLTEQRQLEDDLRRMAAIVESTDDAIISESTDGTILTWNAGAERMYGYRAEEVIGLPISILVPADRPEELRALLDRVWRGEHLEPFETVRLTKDGRRIDVSIRLSATRDDRGTIAGASSIARDITEHKRQEERVRDSEARKGAILQAALDCVITIDHKGTILEFNPAAERTFGYERKDVLGREMADLIIPPALRDRHRAGMARCLSTGEAPVIGKRLELTGMRADGTEFPVELTVTRVELPGPPIFTGYLRDISERREAERNLLHLASIVETSEDAIVSKSLEGVILTWNAGALRMYQYEADEVIGRPVSMLIPSERAHEGEEILDRIRRGEPLERFETIRVRKDGSRFPVSLTISPIRDSAGAIVAASIIAHDMTERKRAEEQLREAEARYRTLVEQIPAVTYVHAVEEVSTTLYISPQVERLVGYPAEEWTGISELWVKLLHPEDGDRVMAEHARTNRTGEPFMLEYRLMHRDGSVVWVRDEALLVRDKHGSPQFWQGIMVDITERKRAEEQIAFLAYHDKLTHLPNRAMFEELLDLALARARRRDQSVAVLYMDLDNFKLVNDSLGHGAGDELLMQMSHRLREVARETDVVARQGGDEFMLLVADLNRHPEPGSPDPVQVAESVAIRIQQALKVPFLLADIEFYISASVGISVFPEDAPDRGSMLRNADSAMYQSKRWRQGGHVVHSMGTTDPLSELSFATQLRRAVEQEHWVLHYQPLVALRDGSILGAEALIRWKDPGGELILPGVFIPMAEEMGLSEAISDWVIQEVCRQAREWQDRGFDISTSFNLSLRQLRRKNLVQHTVSTMEAAGVDPSKMVVEITESTAMNDPDHTQQILWDLHDCGIRLAIDDFGTGYSSFARLKHLPVDYLKIDRAFVRDLPDDQDAQTICTAMVNLAVNLGLVSLAEGIETEAQRRLLIEVGCRQGQGFLFSRAVPADAMTTLMEEPPAASGSTEHLGQPSP